MALTAMEILERCRRAEADKRRLRERVEMYRDAAALHQDQSQLGGGN